MMICKGSESPVYPAQMLAPTYHNAGNQGRVPPVMPAPADSKEPCAGVSRGKEDVALATALVEDDAIANSFVRYGWISRSSSSSDPRFRAWKHASTWHRSKRDVQRVAMIDTCNNKIDKKGGRSRWRNFQLKHRVVRAFNHAGSPWLTSRNDV